MATLIEGRPLIIHVVYRFDVGGLENGVVNLINNMPSSAYRHLILSLTEITDFRKRIQCDDVEFIALNKQPGHIFSLYPQLFTIFKKWRPVVVHTRNLAALEVLVPAWAAGVPVRVHGEHGRDVGDLNGGNRKFQLIRRFYSLFVVHYVALSRDLKDYLIEKIRIPESKISQVYNGVDLSRFQPSNGTLGAPVNGFPFLTNAHWIVGTVGRMEVVKDQPTLARAFVRAIELKPSLRDRLRLVMVGDGSLLFECRRILAEAGLQALSWLPGERDDVPEVMRSLHCFVLPSLAEGISNTILEAMSSELPVIATEVGGNGDLVVDGTTGQLVPAGDVDALARSLIEFASNPERALQMGKEGRKVVEEKFSLKAMVSTYQGLYDRLLEKKSKLCNHSE